MARTLRGENVDWPILRCQEPGSTSEALGFLANGKLHIHAPAPDGSVLVQQIPRKATKDDVFCGSGCGNCCNLQQICGDGAEAVWKRLGITSEFVEAVEFDLRSMSTLFLSLFPPLPQTRW